MSGTETFGRIAVIGGGVVGAAAALAAVRSGAAVTLVEPEPPAAGSAADSAALAHLPIRHVALAPASLDLLRRLKVDMDFAHGRFDRMQVWEACGTADIRFAAKEFDEPVLGWMAELPALNAALWHALERAGDRVVHIREPLSGLVPRVSGWRVRHGARSTDVSLVIAADGARSPTRNLLDVPVSTQPTGHHALASIVRTTLGHANIARQRFLRSGPLALLPTRFPDVVSVVWSADATTIQRLLDGSAEEFAGALSEASDAVLGTVVEIGGRAAFPIVQQVSERLQAAPGVLLLGDAARVLHPLAGLGVNVGLEDVATLWPLLRGAPDDSVAAATTRFSAWARRRRARSRILLGTLATLQRAYDSDEPLAALLRNTGLRWLGGRHLPGTIARRALMREALGI